MSVYTLSWFNADASVAPEVPDDGDPPTYYSFNFSDNYVVPQPPPVMGGIISFTAPAASSQRWFAHIALAFVTPDTRTYTFTVGSDDGHRVWIDGDLLADLWQLGGANSSTFQLACVAGQVITAYITYFNAIGTGYLTFSTDSMVAAYTGPPLPGGPGAGGCP